MDSGFFCAVCLTTGLPNEIVSQLRMQFVVVCYERNNVIYS